MEPTSWRGGGEPTEALDPESGSNPGPSLSRYGLQTTEFFQPPNGNDTYLARQS